MHNQHQTSDQEIDSLVDQSLIDNGEKYLKESIKSLMSQTYKNWEWVVTDDFSNDNGREKLLEISKYE